jgi:hypothetical protein
VICSLSYTTVRLPSSRFREMANSLLGTRIPKHAPNVVVLDGVSFANKFRGEMSRDDGQTQPHWRASREHKVSTRKRGRK